MDIEAIVKKYYEEWQTVPEASIQDQMRAALTELSETHAIELRAYEATVAHLEAKVRELEGGMVPDVAEVLALLDDICSLDPTVSTLAVAQYGAGHLAQRIRHKLAAAPQPKKEG